MKAWRVVANHWKENQGWTYEEDVEEIYDYIDAEGYVNSLDDDVLAGHFFDDTDAIQFDIIDEGGNKVSDFWIDREDAVDHWNCYHIGGEHDGEEIGYFEKETDAINFARSYCKKWDDEPDFMGVSIYDRHGDEVLNW